MSLKSDNDLKVQGCVFGACSAAVKPGRASTGDLQVLLHSICRPAQPRHGARPISAG